MLKTSESNPPYAVDNLLSMRITSLRFLLIVFVVYIHNGVIKKAITSADGLSVFEPPLYVIKVYEFAETITRIAVPLFFIISAVLLYAKEFNFVDNLKKKCRTLALPYFLWTALVVLFYFTAQSFDFTKQYFDNMNVLIFSPLDWLGAFVGHFGRFEGGNEVAPVYGPLLFQFWFIRDLFILNIIAIPIRKAVDLCPGVVLALLFILWIGNVDLYIIHNAALLFFTLGYYIVKYNLRCETIDRIKARDISLMYMTTIAGTLFFTEKIPLFPHLNIIVGILFFIKLSYRFVKSGRLYRVLTRLAQYSFWVYAAHTTLLIIMIKLSVKVMPMKGGWLLVNYLGLTMLCIIVLLGLGYVFRKIFPKAFSILSGGR